MTLSSTELELLRTQPQKSRLYLAILQPKTIFSCQINQNFGTHDMVTEITYDNPVGSYTDVLPGQLCYVGTTNGAKDIGVCRIRSATSTKLYIGEISEIDFADDLYLTVVDSFSIWPRHLRVNGNNVYMDVDIVYSDQHANFDPVPIMGNNVVLNVETYPVQVEFPEVANSWVIGSSILSYSFSASEGVVSDETTSNPKLTISAYPTNGYIRVAETVTAANGKSFTGYRYVFVFDNAHKPITDFSVEDIRGNRDSGGWSCKIRLNNAEDIALLESNRLAVLFAEDWYGDTKTSIGILSGRENIVMSGWISEYSNVDDIEHAPGTFEIQGPHWWLSKISSFPVGVEMCAGTPAAWTEIQSLTIDKGLFHFLHWRTTLTAVTDVFLTGDSRYTASCESPANTLWAQISEIATSQIFAIPLCDKFGRLFVKIPYNLLPESDRASVTDTVMELLDEDYQRPVEDIHWSAPQTSQINLSGVVVSTNAKAEVLFSLSPGHIPLKLGSVQVVERVLLSSQAQSNSLAGLLLAQQNNPYPYISILLVANNRVFDIVPLQRLLLTFNTGLSGYFLPNEVSFEYNEGKLTVTLTVEGETFEQPSCNGDIPVSEDLSLEFPKFPPLPALPPIPSAPITTDDESIEPKFVAIHVLGKGLWFTENFDDDNPVWYSWNSGLDATKIVNDRYYGFEISRVSGRAWLFDSDNNLLTSSSPGQAWTVVTDQQWLVDQIGYGAAGHLPTIGLIGTNRASNDSIFMMAGNHISVFEGTTAAFLGSSSGLTKTWYISSNNHEYGIGWTFTGFAVYGYGEWLAHFRGSSQKILARFTAAGNLITRYELGGGSADMAYIVRGGVGGQTGALWNTSTSHLYKIDANGVTLTETSLTPYSSVYLQYLSAACDPSGQYMVALNNSVATPNLRISSDGGVTWSQPSGWSGVGRAAENCGDAKRWIVQASNGIIYSPDHFTTWTDKTGDLRTKSSYPLDFRAFIIRYGW